MFLLYYKGQGASGDNVPLALENKWDSSRHTSPPPHRALRIEPRC